MLPVFVNLNGQLFFPEQTQDRAHVSVFDRSFLYGDSLYEVVRTYRGKPLGLDEHLDRLEQSAQLCQMRLTLSRQELEARMRSTLDAYLKGTGGKNPNGEAYVRVIVSRGSGAIGFSLKNIETENTVVIMVHALQEPSRAMLERGLHLHVSPRLRNDRRALDPAMKSGNYLNSLLAFLSAESLQQDDALLCDAHGFLTEGTTFNLFYVKRSRVVTPPLESGILEGITRRHILRIAREAGLETREVFFKYESLIEADEVFASSSIKEVFPVTRILHSGGEGSRVAQGQMGPITRLLRERFQTWAQATAR